MASVEPIGRLVARYLDPTKTWDAAHEAALRDLIRDDMDARARYREAVTAHRVMVGADPQFPSGFEARRMRDAAVAAATPSQAPMTRRFAVWGGLLAAGLAVALFTLQPASDRVVLPGGDSATSATDLRTRGGETTSATLGLGLSGVARDMPTDEYEIVAGGGVHLGDFLRVYTTHERPGVTHLFLVVIQAGRAPIWYAPMPPEEAQSVPVLQGRAVMLPAEYAVDEERYAQGPARAIAVFSATPITVAALTPHLDDGLSSLPVPDAARTLSERLGLKAPGEVLVVPFTVSAPRGVNGR
ncbi:MAG: hypothetical protein QF464_08455 [Myxococcota bacterium]|nr:hypothetical protein [Myxococcota bacterium]